ncbi:MAG TPA: SDR family oxidoreductase [Bacilli bacterium]|nr:SDR family oxidoreductase [Bacilli bacterium]
MKALITGASSGLGKSFAQILSEKNYDLILVSRSENELLELKKELDNEKNIVEVLDLSVTDNVKKLYNKYKDENIDLLINNAGVGLYGEFLEGNIDEEINLININIVAVQILTKLFGQKFKERNNGYILNVASNAAFQPGPLMATYYASKSYIYNLTCALYKELKINEANVNISVLCPGPINTNFNQKINIKQSIKGMDSNKVARYALNKMHKGKMLIIPGLSNRIAYYFSRALPIKTLLNIVYSIQVKKRIK